MEKIFSSSLIIKNNMFSFFQGGGRRRKTRHVFFEMLMFIKFEDYPLYSVVLSMSRM